MPKLRLFRYCFSGGGWWFALPAQVRVSKCSGILCMCKHVLLYFGWAFVDLFWFVLF